MSTWGITIIQDSPSIEQLEWQVITRQKPDLVIFPDSLQSNISVISASVLSNGSQAEERGRQQ